MGTTRLRLIARLLSPAILGVPVAAGLLATLLPAFGILPGLEGGASGFSAWGDLFHWPGFSASVMLTVRTGLSATLLSCVSAWTLARSRGRIGAAVRAGAAPLLAMPHAALAVGLGFLIAPTGWIVRLSGLPALGFATVGDHFGAAIIAALWLKETPYLLLALLAGLDQAQISASRSVAASFGYAPGRGDLFAILPRLWPQLRLPVLAVLAFSLSVTDVALILGPQTPPTLAVLVLRWSLDPDLARWSLAAAGALVLLALCLGSFVLLLVAERVAAILGRMWLRTGRRGRAARRGAAVPLAVIIAVVAAMALMVLALWAGAASWRFPAPLPEGWTLGRLAARASDLGHPALTTLWLALASALTALALAVAILESGGLPSTAWLPLLLPQAGFLFGVQVLLVWLRLDGSAFALIWAHVVFVLPYVLLALAGPWRALDPRYARAAAALGASPLRVLLRVTLPLLVRPLTAAAAIGVAVSVGLYLPTLFAGAGRVATLATEAVTLSAGSDRRILAATALAQAALPLAGFAVAFGLRPRP